MDAWLARTTLQTGPDTVTLQTADFWRLLAILAAAGILTRGNVLIVEPTAGG